MLLDGTGGAAGLNDEELPESSAHRKKSQPPSLLEHL